MRPAQSAQRTPEQVTLTIERVPDVHHIIVLAFLERRLERDRGPAPGGDGGVSMFGRERDRAWGCA